MRSVKAQVGAAETPLERGLAQAIVWPPRAAVSVVSVALLPGRRAHAFAAVPARVAETLVRPFPAAQAVARSGAAAPDGMARLRPGAAAEEVGVAEPAAQHGAPARPLVAAGAAAHAEEVPEAAGAEVRPPGVAAAVAAQRDAAERAAVVAVAPDAEVRRPEAAGEPVGAEAGQPGGPEAGPAPAAGRPSVLPWGAAWVCRRDRPRQAAARPGPRRQARPAQTKRCLQWTSP